MSEQDKERQWIYDLLNTETKTKISEEFLYGLHQEFLYGLHQDQTLAPLITLYGPF